MSFIERLVDILESPELKVGGVPISMRAERFWLAQIIGLEVVWEQLEKTLDEEIAWGLKHSQSVLPRDPDSSPSDISAVRERELKVTRAIGAPSQMRQRVLKNDLPRNRRDLVYLEGMLVVSMLSSVMPEKVTNLFLMELRDFVGYENLHEVRAEMIKAK